ncbi:MAG: DUF423 domain-containing protein [Planctomycetaceae bacterium]|nr:DUF423 domain-containing protein [Planctomycetales bacterium]MCB9874365.1 DUF423 domain-containing protein [Planctomycetaceae bacterium]MCB9940505.1 DUF423 domain-containing protein [Planctomycetaceae bacterium]
MNDRHILIAGAVLGGLSVALGAFGAHSLREAVTQWGLEPAEQLKRLENWEVAARYQMYHALALLALGLLARQRSSPCLTFSAMFFVVGTCIFSGCLYALVLTGTKILGAIVPIGGTCLIVGWILFAIVAAKSQDRVAQ